jgi:hypothetical protein
MELAKAEDRNLLAVLRGVSDGSKHGIDEIPCEGPRYVVFFDYDVDQVVFPLSSGVFAIKESAPASRVG